MTNLGTPTRRNISLEDLFRTTLNKILEDEVKAGGKVPQPIAAVTIPETIDIAHTEPTINTTTATGFTYEDAVGIWRFNEGTTALSGFTGSLAIDESGFVNHGDISGATFTTGKSGLGWALNLDGSNNNIKISNTTILGFSTGDFTIMAWVKTGSTAESIISKGGFFSSSQAGWHISWAGSPNLIFFEVSDGSTRKNVRFANTTSPLANFTFITAVQRSGTIEAWTNGIIGSTLTTTLDVSNSLDIYFGKVATSAARFFGGDLDGVRVYNRAVSTTEIQMGYQNFFPYYDQSYYQ